jgi:hypothetical protein
MTKLVLLFLTLSLTSVGYSQTAHIKVERIFYPNSYEKFDSIDFIINGTSFSGKDTAKHTFKLSLGLDQCSAIIDGDTLKFLAKFQNNKTYVVRPGCCCAAFTLEPTDNSRRGTVTFKNNTKRDLGLIVAEANIDTISKEAVKEMFSHESAMCLFKPCSIMLVETEYLNDKYNYGNDNLDYDSLWKEQANFVLSLGYFHFLHGEKIEIVYSEATKSMQFQLNGYLTDEEYKRWRD